MDTWFVPANTRKHKIDVLYCMIFLTLMAVPVCQVSIYLVQNDEANLFSESVEASVLKRYFKHNDPKTKSLDNVQQALQGCTWRAANLESKVSIQSISNSVTLFEKHISVKLTTKYISLWDSSANISSLLLTVAPVTVTN